MLLSIFFLFLKRIGANELSPELHQMMIEVLIHTNTPFTGSELTEERMGMICTLAFTCSLKGLNRLDQLLLLLLKIPGICYCQIGSCRRIFPEWFIARIEWPEQAAKYSAYKDPW
jgi:hypothetical protein